MAIESKGASTVTTTGGVQIAGNGEDGQMPELEQVAAGPGEEGAPYAVIEGREFKTADELKEWYDGGMKPAGEETATGGNATDTLNGGNGKDTVAAADKKDEIKPAPRTDDEIRAALKEAGGIYANEAYAPAALEFEKTGTVSEETLAKTAEALGVPLDFAKEFVKNAATARDAAAQATAAAQTGQPSKEAIAMGKVALEVIPEAKDYDATMAWAKDNISPADQASYDAALDRGDAPVVKTMLQAFLNQFQASGEARGPRDVTQEGGAQHGDGQGGDGYASQAEMEKDMNDPRYKSDRAFIKTVEGKVARAKF